MNSLWILEVWDLLTLVQDSHLSQDLLWDEVDCSDHQWHPINQGVGKSVHLHPLLTVLLPIAELKLAEAVINPLCFAEAVHETLLFFTFFEVIKGLICCDHNWALTFDLWRKRLNFFVRCGSVQVDQSTDYKEQERYERSDQSSASARRLWESKVFP